MSVRRRLFRTKKSMESLYLGKPVDKDFESEIYKSHRIAVWGLTHLLLMLSIVRFVCPSLR